MHRQPTQERSFRPGGVLETARLIPGQALLLTAREQGEGIPGGFVAGSPQREQGWIPGEVGFQPVKSLPGPLRRRAPIQLERDFQAGQQALAVAQGHGERFAHRLVQPLERGVRVLLHRKHFSQRQAVADQIRGRPGVRLPRAHRLLQADDGLGHHSPDRQIVGQHGRTLTRAQGVQALDVVGGPLIAGLGGRTGQQEDLEEVGRLVGLGAPVSDDAGPVRADPGDLGRGARANGVTRAGHVDFLDALQHCEGGVTISQGFAIQGAIFHLRHLVAFLLRNFQEQLGIEPGRAPDGAGEGELQQVAIVGVHFDALSQHGLRQSGLGDEAREEPFRIHHAPGLHRRRAIRLLAEALPDAPEVVHNVLLRADEEQIPALRAPGVHRVEDRRHRGVDDADGLAIDLVGLHPLHKQPGRTQPSHRRLIKLLRVQTAHAGAVGIRRLGGNQIVSLAGGEHRLARVTEAQVQLGIVERVVIHRRADARHMRYLRLQFHHVHPFHPRDGRQPPGGGARAQPDDERAPRIGMRQGADHAHHHLRRRVATRAAITLAVDEK